MLRLTRSLLFLILGTLTLLVYAACGSDSPTAPTQAPGPQPTSFNVTVTFTSGTGGLRGIDAGDPTLDLSISGTILIQVQGGNGTANDVVATLTGTTADQMPFMIEENFGTINGTADRTFNQQFPSTYPPPDPLFTDINIEVVGTDPVTGQQVIVLRDVNDVGPDLTDPVPPAPCGQPEEACLFNDHIHVSTEFTGQPGNLINTGQPNPSLEFALFGTPGSSTPVVFVDIFDRCNDNGFYWLDLQVQTPNQMNLFLVTEDGLKRVYFKTSGAPTENIFDQEAIPCDPFAPTSSMTPQPTSTSAPFPTQTPSPSSTPTATTTASVAGGGRRSAR